MKAGKELDRLISEHIMHDEMSLNTGAYVRRINTLLTAPAPSYSTNLNEAIAIFYRWYSGGLVPYLDMDGHTGIRAGVVTDKGRFIMQGDTPEHAICLLALKVAGVDVAYDEDE